MNPESHNESSIWSRIRLVCREEVSRAKLSDRQQIRIQAAIASLGGHRASESDCKMPRWESHQVARRAVEDADALCDQLFGADITDISSSDDNSVVYYTPEGVKALRDSHERLREACRVACETLDIVVADDVPLSEPARIATALARNALAQCPEVEQ